MIGDAPTINFLRGFLQKQYGVVGMFEIFYHNEGYFVIRFALQQDKDRIMGEGPWMIANRPMIIKDWVVDFNFEKEVLKEVPLWIRLPKLLLSCWSADSLSRIGSVVGTPVCADECTTQQTRISYARLLVEVDVTKPLIYKVQVKTRKVSKLSSKFTTNGYLYFVRSAIELATSASHKLLLSHRK